MKKAADFPTQKDFFAYLAANQREIAEMKKAARKFTDPFGITAIQRHAIKAMNTAHKDDPASGMIKRTLVLNTYNWMDSHDDVHMDGVFAGSIKDRQDKIFHLHDHLFQVTAKVGKPTAIYEKSIPWAALGVDKTGDTMALFMDSNIMKDWNEKVFQQYLDGEINQHSVAMQYLDLSLAMNDPEYKAEFATWQSMIDKVGNRADAEKQGFFWAVKEAKIFEGSSVLEGSNPLTPTLENIDPGAAGKSDPPKELSFSERLMKELLR